MTTGGGGKAGCGDTVRPMSRASGGRLIYWEGSRGFPGGQWPTCLRISQLSLLLAAADMVTSSTHSGSHREDIMGIMAGLAAVTGVFFFIPPFHPTFSDHLLQPSPSWMCVRTKEIKLKAQTWSSTWSTCALISEQEFNRKRLCTPHWLIPTLAAVQQTSMQIWGNICIRLEIILGTTWWTQSSDFLTLSACCLVLGR